MNERSMDMITLAGGLIAILLFPIVFIVLVIIMWLMLEPDIIDHYGLS